MDVNTFYELRTRLYATAAAGCGLIAEDFRLKRALEAFKPMSEANKVFGRLYQMCENLFHTENVAGELVDCIALADALAVTQGSFLDKSECVEEEHKLCLKPQTIANRYLEEVKTTLSKGEINIQHDVQKDIQLMLEPRVFPCFIQSLKQDTNSTRSLAEVLLPRLGDAIIPVLKKQIDLETNSAKNKTAYYIRLICQLFGYQENDWYLSLIEEEGYPKSIRVAAVNALGCSEKNVPKLLELYKTQKGVVKTAVILVLAKLDPPEAEDIWKKITKKYMVPSSDSVYDLSMPESTRDVIVQSKSDICAEFARKLVADAIEIGKRRNGNRSKITTAENRCLNLALQTIFRKPQLEDCFMMLAENYKYIEGLIDTFLSTNPRNDLNQALVSNLLEEDERYIEMIKNLYKVHKNFYFPARFFLALKEKGNHAFTEYREEIYENRDDVINILRSISYDCIREGYYLSWWCVSGLGYRSQSRTHLRIFEEIPEEVFSFITDTSYFAPEKQDKNIATKLTKCQRACSKKTKDTIRTVIQLFDGWLRYHITGSKEYQKCVNTAVKYALAVNKYCSTGAEIDILVDYYANGTPEEYRDMFINYSIQSILSGDGHIWSIYMKSKLESMPLSYEDRKKALLEVKEIIEQFENIDEKNKKEMLSKTDQVLKSTYTT
ncbi:MAG: HEAT repeat domain-containing protein [Clostridiales bacterium]|nr:HEAT repeat domain-containing protein [Clostridiales bacterium]